MQTNSENFWKTNVSNELKTKALEMSDDKLETTAPNCVQLLFFFEARQALASHNNDGLKKKTFLSSSAHSLSPSTPVFCCSIKRWPKRRFKFLVILISPTFNTKLLCAQIPKAQKIQSSHLSFFWHFWDLHL